MTLADNILYLKKVLTGVGLKDQYDADATAELGGLQTLFNVGQAKNLIAYINTRYDNSFYSMRLLNSMWFEVNDTTVLHCATECAHVL